MRRLPFSPARFDVLYNLLNSFGYYPPPLGSSPAQRAAADVAILREWRRVLRRGGRLVLDLSNRRPLLQIIRRNPRVRYAGGDCEAEEYFAWDPREECLCNRTIWRWRPASTTAAPADPAAPDYSQFSAELPQAAGPRTRTERGAYRVRLYTPRQITALLQSAGFAPQALYGDFASTPYNPHTSDRMLVIAQAT
jgi:SAM-dependent methyltransferase